MIRLGLHLTLRSGREALIRLLVTALSVAVGVGLLLSVLAMYQAYRDGVDKPCWQCTNVTDPNGSLLWNFSQDEYDGRSVDRLDVAVVGRVVPALPGLSAMPAPGQYYASPALAALLRTAPADQLADRFPGTLAGTIGPDALRGPEDLTVMIGHSPADLSTFQHTVRVSDVQRSPRGLSTSQFYQFGFALGAVALLVPMLVLIGNATRMAAARREERYAAMRLVGAERAQVSVVASVDAVLGAVLGALAGIGVFAALRPLLTDIPLLGYRFFDATVEPPSWGYPGVLLAVPAAAAVACLISLRRVQISPLGVSRRVTPRAPRFWRVLPLLVGLATFMVPLLTAPSATRGSPMVAVLALVLVMAGMMIAGPWLTMNAARLLARWTVGGSSLLAARRLADNPRASFRAVSGLMLAVMIGTALAALVPAAVAAQDTSHVGALRDVLRVGFTQAGRSKLGSDRLPGLMPQQAAPLLAKLSAVPGATVVPLYHPSAAGDSEDRRGGQAVARCADVRALPVLGTCPAGATAVLIDTSTMYVDNLRVLDASLPFVTAHNPVVADDGTPQLLSDLLVRTDGPATLERVRTALAGYRDNIDTSEAPMTFGEVSDVRARLYLEIERIVTVLAGVTLLVAGCGLAVAISGSLVERKRPFTLLRVTGTGVGTLYRAVLLETVLPLAAATVVAAGIGMAVAYPIARALAPQRHALVLPHPSFYLTLAGGLVVSVTLIAACLPILGRMTTAHNVRFE